MKNKKESLITKLIGMRTASADVMNTIVQDTGTKLGNGTDALKLDNHLRQVYSNEIMYKAMPIMKFLQFAKVQTELNTQPGLSIQIMTYDNLKRGGELIEGTQMTTQGLSSSMKEIKVAERGNAISVSELALKSAFTNIITDATELLSRDVALTLDLELRDVVLSAPQVIYGRKKGDAKVTSRASLTASNEISVATIKDAVEILATNNVPKFGGQHYVCFLHPHQSRILRDDPAWINASNYGAPESLFTGEIGKIDDVRFIETTVMCNGAVADTDISYKADLKAEELPVYQASLFGEHFYGFAVGLPVELRDNGVQDFGREHGLAWYAIWGAGLLNETRGLVIETV